MIFPRFLTVHFFILYFLVTFACAFAGEGAWFPIFSWRIFDSYQDKKEFLDVHVVTDSRDCLLAHCFEERVDRNVVWDLLQKISYQVSDGCVNPSSADKNHLRLLRELLKSYFSKESIVRLDIVYIKHSFTDYVLKRVPDDQIDKKTCLSL